MELPTFDERILKFSNELPSFSCDVLTVYWMIQEGKSWKEVETVFPRMFTLEFNQIKNARKLGPGLVEIVGNLSSTKASVGMVKPWE